MGLRPLFIWFSLSVFESRGSPVAPETVFLHNPSDALVPYSVPQASSEELDVPMCLFSVTFQCDPVQCRGLCKILLKMLHSVFPLHLFSTSFQWWFNFLHFFFSPLTSLRVGSGSMYCCLSEVLKRITCSSVVTSLIYRREREWIYKANIFTV
jgi:hypothetical protein